MQTTRILPPSIEGCQVPDLATQSGPFPQDYVPPGLDMQEFRPSSQLCSVVGMALNYAGHPGTLGFWDTACGPGDVQGEVPYARWNIDAAYSPDICPGKMVASTRQAITLFQREKVGISSPRRYIYLEIRYNIT
jgi:hypothetical protein